MNRVFRSLIITVALITSCNSLALNPSGFEQITHIGHVYARAVIRDEDTGLPLWAEYNEDGGHTKLSIDDLELANNGQVVSAESYNKFIATLDTFKEKYEGEVTVYNREEYEQESSGLLTHFEEVMTDWPTRLPEGILSIAIPDKKHRLLKDATKTERLFFPVNLKDLPALEPQTLSVLIDKDGKLIEESDGRIGYLTAYYTKKGEELPDSEEYEYASMLKRLHDYDIHDPVSGVLIEGITGYINGADISASDGSYSLKMFPSPCPGFIYQPKGYARAELHYTNYNPKGAATIPYWLERESYDSCNGMALLLRGIPSIGAQMAANTITGIVTAAPENITTFNYQIGINVIAGRVLLDKVEITEDETQYEAEQSPEEEYMVSNDYDGDGQEDPTKRGYRDEDGKFVEDSGAQYYGVFLSGSPLPDNQPNFIRLVDVKPDADDKGLPTKLSEKDLENTDIFVFRESTGQLITERISLEKDEVRRVLGDTIIDKDKAFTFTMPIRSTEDSSSFRKKRFDDWEAWQSAAKMNPDLQKHKADFLRNGEKLRVIVINRATGYIGSKVTDMTAAKDGGDITSQIGDIILGPPNLKIWATRKYQPEGLRADDDHEERTISNEGAAEVDDEVIEIHTQWLDADGYPLPEELEGRGYTGRLVKVAQDPESADNPFSTGVSSNVSEFPIDPGKKLQVLKFSAGSAEKFHYYLQVSGESDGEQADFSVGELTGTLRHRPNKYVPVLVPLFNEQETANDRIEQINALANEDNLEENKDKELDVKPVFDWVYRPELAFSVIDLEMQEINLHYKDENQTAKDIIQSSDPIITTEVDVVELLFQLSESDYDRITPLDGEQEYILAIGEEEFSIIVDKSNPTEPIRFTNIEHLSKLNEEDYLTMRLYLNQDSENILWEYAFIHKGLLINTSSDPGSRSNNSFIIVPEKVYQAKGDELLTPQDPFKLTLAYALDYSKGESYKWEISVVDKDKYGEFEFVDIAPSGKFTTENGKYVWRSDLLKTDEFKELKIRPKEPEPSHTPETYTAGSGGTKEIDEKQKNPQFEYEVKVIAYSSIEGALPFENTIKMDDKDTIRQEYINHVISAGSNGIVSSSRVENVYVPTRAELIDKNSLGSVLAGDWSQGEYQHLRETNMVKLANMVKEAFKQQPAVTLTETMDENGQPTNVSVDLKAGSELVNSLKVNSGWRNPERNEIVGGAKTSNHMTGNALDIITTLDGEDKAKLFWVFWRAVQNMPVTEGNIRFRYLLEDPGPVANAGDLTLYPGTDSFISMEDIKKTDNSDGADGIPDVFNNATHFHVETFVRK